MLKKVTVDSAGKLSPCIQRIKGIEVTMRFSGNRTHGDIKINVEDLAGSLKEERGVWKFVLDQRSRVKLILSVYYAFVSEPGEFCSPVAEQIHEKVKEGNSRD